MEVIKEHSDEELLGLLVAPRTMDAVIKSLYREYYSFLENYVINNTGTKDDAADVIQDAIIAFIEIVQENRFRGESSIKSFLYAITRNIWLAELRKRSSRDNRNRIFEKAKDTEEAAITQHLIQREHYTLIKQLLDKLGEKCKQLLLLVYYEDLSMQDIMQHMPDYQNEQVLRNKKYKCMKQLEQMMNDDVYLKNQFKNALKNAG